MSMQTLGARLQILGENNHERMDRAKLYSFKQAMKNSYNTRMIKPDDGNSAWPCLINSMSGGNKADYNKQYLSVEFDSGLTPGDTFQMIDSGEHWMVYLPIVTETAYLRTEIIRCRYSLNVNGEDYWIAVRGPVETDLRWFIKNNININELNLSGRLYIKNDENTRQFFHRFTHIKLAGHTWEVQVTDSITVPGILELEIQEYYDNSIAELPSILKDETTPINVISGTTTVKQDTVVGYAISNEAYDPKIHWEVKNNPRVKVLEEYEDGRMCKVKVYAGAVKTFDICYGDFFQTVIVEWQKPLIQGPQEVYPYDTHTYWIKKLPEGEKVTFSIDDESMAKIVDSNNDSCKVEIVSGKKGKFVIHAAYGDVETDLPVKIKSL
uniref:Uncharacterized protein n=1 Tax=Siphoviridae sp. ctnPP24 TaxID=2825662 RepID=A0A8S5TZ60_9CAUD|nr:MAG TPA: hypothetical protein [Siphoviridae sp. ctnPP24]